MNLVGSSLTSGSGGMFGLVTKRDTHRCTDTGLAAQQVNMAEVVCPRPPTEKPDFTVGTLRKAIPAHCFKRSLWRSFSYLLADLVAIAVLYYLSTYIDQVAPVWLAYGALWPLYWFFQGAVATGPCHASVARLAFNV